MADSVQIHLCILWEDELRTAAKALRALHEAPENISDEQQRQLVRAAMNSALVALWGLTDDHVCVLVGSGELNKLARKQRAHDSSGEHTT